MARQLTDPRFKLAEHARNVYRATPELGTSFEEMLAPGYWANIARKLRAGDRIEVVADDFSAYGELFVRRATPTEAFVSVVRPFEPFEDTAPSDATRLTAEDFRVEHNATEQWRVVRLCDGEVVKRDLLSEPAAKRALAAYLKSLG